MSASDTKLGLFVPPPLHDRLRIRAGATGVGDAYAQALEDLLDALDAGEAVTFAAVRGPKKRVTVRLDPALVARLRGRLVARNLKITDFVCAALVRRFPETPGD